MPLSGIERGVPEEVFHSAIIRVILLPARCAVVIHMVSVGMRLSSGLPAVVVSWLVGVDNPRFVARIWDESAGNVIQIAPAWHDHLLTTQGWLHFSL